MAKLDAVIRWFMPKEERFHELLARNTANLLRAAQLFSEFAHTADLEARRIRLSALKDREHEGDQLTRQIFDALNSSFITPFDREDIRSIATDLDDILDYLEGVAQHIVLFDLNEAPEGLRQFSEILVEMAEEIERLTALIWDLSNQREIHECIVRISDLENRADVLYNALIADLFRGNGRDPIEILKWKEVYEGLENACDQCKNYSHVLGNVVVKNS
jgi:predicted phosphate transport protein (TIGR00153 family)